MDRPSIELLIEVYRRSPSCVYTVTCEPRRAVSYRAKRARNRFNSQVCALTWSCSRRYSCSSLASSDSCAPDILRTIVLVSLPPRTRHDRTRALPSQRSRRLAIKAFIEPSVNERGHVSPVGCQSLRVAALVEMPQPNSTHESRKPLQYFAEW